ncbi:MAG: nitroreductase family protein [Spirochaetales bacterium]|nr:nitroreductase family protein [Spirochaetales bacterium]
MLELKIDQELCTKCGECIKDCPVLVLEFDGGVPSVKEGKGDQCIECQHCFTVCKPGALSIFSLDPARSTPLEGNLPEPEKMKTLLEGRRSVRRYKKEGVEPGLLKGILESVRNAPTGVNRRSTALHVIDDREVMDELRRLTYKGIGEALDSGTLPEELKSYAGFLGAYEKKGIDVIYRDAPHGLFTSAPKSNPSGVTDGVIALAYFEMLAVSHGLGVVWDGIAKVGLKTVAREAYDFLGIPEDHELVYVMPFGVPAVKYYRTVQRPGGTVHPVGL